MWLTLAACPSNMLFIKMITVELIINILLAWFMPSVLLCWSLTWLMCKMMALFIVICLGWFVRWINNRLQCQILYSWCFENNLKITPCCCLRVVQLLYSDSSVSESFSLWKQNLFLISFPNIHSEKVICIFLKGGLLHRKENVNMYLK